MEVGVGVPAEGAEGREFFFQFDDRCRSERLPGFVAREAVDLFS